MEISKREKIILGLTVLAVIYAGIVFFSSGPEDITSRSGGDGSSAEDLVTEVVESLALHSRTETERFILEKAQIRWPSDPFITSIASSPGDREPGERTNMDTDEVFNYTGYVEIGSKRLAIINGEEYETGDKVIESPFTVRGITPEQVLLENAGNPIRVVPMADDSAP